MRCLSARLRVPPAHSLTPTGGTGTAGLHRTRSFWYCSSVSSSHIPPRPISIPRSSAWSTSKLIVTPPRRAISRTFSWLSRMTFLGRKVLRSSSRNWHNQPFRNMKDMYTRCRFRSPRHLAQSCSPIVWGAGSDVLQSAQMWPARICRTVDERSLPMDQEYIKFAICSPLLKSSRYQLFVPPPRIRTRVPFGRDRCWSHRPKRFLPGVRAVASSSIDPLIKTENPVEAGVAAQDVSSGSGTPDL
jgi:hypothetical protein